MGREKRKQTVASQKDADQQTKAHDAQVAAERSEAEISPKFDASADYFYQAGREGLADITRQKYTVSGSIPLGDEDEYLRIGYSRELLHPHNAGYPDTEGNIPFFRVQKRFCDDLLLTYAQVNVEQFNNGGFETRPTFDVGGIFQYCDWVWLRGLKASSFGINRKLEVSDHFPLWTNVKL